MSALNFLKLEDNLKCKPKESESKSSTVSSGNDSGSSTSNVELSNSGPSSSTIRRPLHPPSAFGGPQPLMAFNNNIRPPNNYHQQQVWYVNRFINTDGKRMCFYELY